jgi:hypothetical protein
VTFNHFGQQVRLLNYDMSEGSDDSMPSLSIARWCSPILTRNAMSLSSGLFHFVRKKRELVWELWRGHEGRLAHLQGTKNGPENGI